MKQWLRSKRYVGMLRDYPLQQEPDLYKVRDLLKPGDIAIDIGASIGLYTRYLSEWVGPTGWVFACEPVPDTCDVLRRNLRGLGIWNVIVMEAALSSASGRIKMDVPQGKSHYYAQVAPTGQYDVQAYTFDELFGRLHDVAFVKCDVEGHEPELLRGADSFLSRCDAVWLVEVDKCGDEITAIFDKYGYLPNHTGAENCFFSRRPLTER